MTTRMQVTLDPEKHRRAQRRAAQLGISLSEFVRRAVDEADQAHARAVRALASGELLVTTDHVLVESWSLIEGRMGRHLAERFWGEIRGGGASIELVTPADLEAAWAIGEGLGGPEGSPVG